MTSTTQAAPGQKEVVVEAIGLADWQARSGGRDQAGRAAALAGFMGKAGQIALVPGSDGRVTRVLFGLGGDGGEGAMVFRGLAGALPPGDYRLEATPAGMDANQIGVAFALGAYRFDRYKRAPAAAPRLGLPPGADAEKVRSQAHALALARDMINTPANDMGPLQVESIAREVAEAHGARIAVTTGDNLIEAGYPAVHAVGRAAAPHRAPRMIEIEWSSLGRGARVPHIVVIGKGVVFDSGGLDIKPSAGMRQMKKDMGGAAHALALGRMVMAADLPVRLTVLTPVVENAISGDAMRPGDVLASRKGLSIEVGNTDAEGRLILADALARAGELEPDLTIDLATLTGAARVALGPDVPAFFTDDEELASDIVAASARVNDPVWRMPLWGGYESAIDSDIADVTNESDVWAQAGSVTAALFLKRFAPPGPWVHFDLFAWNPRNRPGWPRGAAAQTIRAIYAVLEGRYP